MQKYLFQASYTDTGLKGLLDESGTHRQQAVEQTIKSLGGNMEAFYYAFGETDVFVIADLPDNVSATSFSLVTNAAGTAKVRTTVLLSPDQIDQATKKEVIYRPPGIVSGP
jgi:uncharacterized protein with GYD domain